MVKKFNFLIFDFIRKLHYDQINTIQMSQKINAFERFFFSKRRKNFIFLFANFFLNFVWYFECVYDLLEQVVTFSCFILLVIMRLLYNFHAFKNWSVLKNSLKKCLIKNKPKLKNSAIDIFFISSYEPKNNECLRLRADENLNKSYKFYDRNLDVSRN